MERRMWTLLAIAAGGDSDVSPVQLQKGLFLLGAECPEGVAPGFYDFQPYDYGPFDAEVYRDARELESEGLITIRPVPGQRWHDYRITSQGEQKRVELQDQVSPEVWSHLQAIMKSVRSQSFSALVRSIYQRFPAMKANSVFQD